MEEKNKCPHCKEADIVKRGVSRTKNRGKQQRYLCKSCNKSFIQNDGFLKKKFNGKIIAMCVDMYLSNLSSRKMRNQLRRHFGIKVSHETILNWVREYVVKVKKYVSKLKPKLSGKIYADETMINRKGQWDTFWCSVDWETRFINAEFYSHKSQNMKDAISFCRKIRLSGDVSFIQTDALPHYPRAIRKVFYYNKKKSIIIEHKVNNVSRTKKHNVRIETVFSKIKDRVKDFRGLKALWSAQILLTGLTIQHNFIEAHMGTGRVPCELAGHKPCSSENRWLELIKISAL